MTEASIGIAFYASLAGLALLSVPLWRRFWQHVQQQQPVVVARDQIASPIGLVDVGFFVLAWALAQLLSIVGVVWLTDVDPAALDTLSGRRMAFLMMVVAVGQMLATAFGLWYLYTRYQTRHVLGWQSAMIVPDLKLAAAAFVMFAPLTLLIQGLLSMLVQYSHPVLNSMIENADAFTVLATWFTAVLAAPVTEEIFFRGVVQSWLQRLDWSNPLALSHSMAGGWFDPLATPKASANARNEIANSSNEIDADAAPALVITKGWRWQPILITSLLFALVHSGHGLAAIPLFGFSIVLGFLYQRTGSLLPAIGLHMLLNGFSVFWLTVQILFMNADALSTVPVTP